MTVRPDAIRSRSAAVRRAASAAEVVQRSPLLRHVGAAPPGWAKAIAASRW